jgi:hypothetical protein
MAIEVCITGAELRKALAAIEAAEANGFDHCLAVLKLISAGFTVSEGVVEYSDLLERAHPTDGRLDWGRFQGVTERNRFIRGKLVPLQGAAS